MAVPDVYQQVVKLSSVSNVLRGALGHKKKLLDLFQKLLDDNLSNYMEDPKWKVVWGPTLRKIVPFDPPWLPADNYWLVFRNPEQLFPDGSLRDTYVVSLNGTISDAGWLVMDFDVKAVSDFDKFIKNTFSAHPKHPTRDTPKPSGTYIARGTAGATFALLTTPAPPKAAGAGLSLTEFISNHIPEGATIIFTGHSLGGTVSPTMATALHEGGKLAKFAPGNVLTYPTAGVSPGDDKFASRFAKAFPAVPPAPDAAPYQAWNLNMWHDHDPVPQAWSTSVPERKLSNIAKLFGGHVKLVGKAVDKMIDASDGSHIQYTPLQGCRFDTADPGTAKDWTTWINMAHTQHVPVYADTIGVKLAHWYDPANGGMDVEWASKPQILDTYPVIHDVMLGVRLAMEDEDSEVQVAEFDSGEWASDLKF